MRNRLAGAILTAAFLVSPVSSAQGIGNGSGVGSAGNIATSREGCTAATLVTYRKRPAVLTAGHCTRSQAGNVWRQGRYAIGSGYMWTMGNGDYGTISGTANVRRATAVRNPRGGESLDIVTARGVFRGRVVSASTSVRYASPGVPAVTVSGVARLSGVCLRGGDSGSGVWSGRTLVGIVDAVGAGCTVWFTRAADAFARSGLRVR